MCDDKQNELMILAAAMYEEFQSWIKVVLTMDQDESGNMIVPVETVHAWEYLAVTAFDQLDEGRIGVQLGKAFRVHLKITPNLTYEAALQEFSPRSYWWLKGK